MSLAPTLLLTNVIVAGLGAVSMAGQVPSADNPNLATRSPAPAGLVVATEAPTAIIAAGPYAAPDRNALALSGPIPVLGKIRIVYPSLPDVEGVDNDLTPTVVQRVDLVLEPAQAEMRFARLGQIMPIVITDGSQIAYVEGTGPATMSALVGLTPTLVLPAGEVVDRFPIKGRIDLLGLEPTMFLPWTITVPPSMVTSNPPVVRGLAPTLTLRYDWRTVALTGEVVWTDIAAV